MFKKIYQYFMDRPQYLIYIYFFILTGLIATSIANEIIPDETVHIAAVEFYSRFTPSPFISEQTDSFIAGELARTGSYLYYYLLGFVHNLIKVTGEEPLIPLRIISALFSVGTLIYLNKIATHLKVEKRIRLAALFLIANIPMFIIISAGINYDALTFLLATATGYTMLLIAEKLTLFRSIVLFSLIVAGPLVKFAFAPISVAATLTFVYLYFTKDSKKTSKKKSENKTKWQLYVLGVLLVFMTILLVERYGRNYIDYGRLDPKCDQVLTEDQCSKNSVYRRNKIFEVANQLEPKINYPTYLSEWVQIMNQRTFGILTHRRFINNHTVINLGLFINLVLAIIFIRKYKFKRNTLYFIISTSIYVISLIMINLGTYRNSLSIDLAVQGRYLFVVSFSFAFFILSLVSKELSKIRTSFAYNLLIAVLVTFAILIGPANLKYGTDRGWIRPDRPYIRKLIHSY